VFVVDDDRSVRAALRTVREDDGRVVEDYAGSDAFLTAFKKKTGGNVPFPVVRRTLFA
jgi:FixJ family two-component response regulator